MDLEHNDSAESADNDRLPFGKVVTARLKYELYRAGGYAIAGVGFYFSGKLLGKEIEENPKIQEAIGVGGVALSFLKLHWANRPINIKRELKHHGLLESSHDEKLVYRTAGTRRRKTKRLSALGITAFSLLGVVGLAKDVSEDQSKDTTTTSTLAPTGSVLQDADCPVDISQFDLPEGQGDVEDISIAQAQLQKRNAYMEVIDGVEGEFTRRAIDAVQLSIGQDPQEPFNEITCAGLFGSDTPIEP